PGGGGRGRRGGHGGGADLPGDHRVAAAAAGRADARRAGAVEGDLSRTGPSRQPGGAAGRSNRSPPEGPAGRSNRSPPEGPAGRSNRSPPEGPAGRSAPARLDRAGFRANSPCGYGRMSDRAGHGPAVPRTGTPRRTLRGLPESRTGEHT